MRTTTKSLGAFAVLALTAIPIQRVRAQATTARIVTAAKSFLASLDDEPHRKRWSNLPTSIVERAGLSPGELSEPQRAQALALAKPNFSLERLANMFGRSTERYKRLLRLRYLLPKIVKTIVEGQTTADFTRRYHTNPDATPLMRSPH